MTDVRLTREYNGIPKRVFVSIGRPDDQARRADEENLISTKISETDCC